MALKHRQGKNHRPRIVVFVGSPLEVDGNEFNKLAKRLKKEKISIDIVVFGEEVKNFVDERNSFSIESLVFSRKIRRIYYDNQWKRKCQVERRVFFSMFENQFIEHLFSSHLICVPSGANLPDTLINTPIIQSEDGSGLPTGYSASAFAMGVNPEDDPELAMVNPHF